MTQRLRGALFVLVAMLLGACATVPSLDREMVRTSRAPAVVLEGAHGPLSHAQSEKILADLVTHLHIASGGLIFPDGSLQTKAQVAGPQGPQGPAGTQGPTGPQGPPGPTGPITFSAHCAGTFFSGDSVVLNPLGQTTAQYCSSLYRGITVLYQGEFGEAQGGNFSIYTDTGNTKVDTQYGFAAPRAGTLTNLRITAITKGSASTSGRVLVRKIRTDNTIDNNSSDVNLTCTVGTGTSCSDTTHTLAISAGERILVTAYTASAETLTSLSVLVDLQ